MSITFFFFRIYFIVIQERGGREREGETSMGERNTHWLPPAHTLTRDRACNLGMCPGGELNRQSFSYGTVLQPTEPCWPGPYCILFVQREKLSKVQKGDCQCIKAAKWHSCQFLFWLPCPLFPCARASSLGREKGIWVSPKAQKWCESRLILCSQAPDAQRGRMKGGFHLQASSG